MKTREGFWKLTPSSLYGYEECKACYWIEQNIGRAPSIPFLLNSAIDEKLKVRYDDYRKRRELPPEIRMLKGVKLFADLDTIETWRMSTAALRYINEKKGYALEGKLDEVLVNDKEELVPADFKASGNPPREDKHKYYLSQLHAYALMLKRKGYPVAANAYLIHYFVSNKETPELDISLGSHIDNVSIDLGPFEKKLEEIVALLESRFPGHNDSCEKCRWHKRRVEISEQAGGKQQCFGF